jgi:hypothetical protein
MKVSAKTIETGKAIITATEPRKQQQQGDNFIHHCRNSHGKFHIASYMKSEGIKSRFDLDSLIERHGSAIKK